MKMKKKITAMLLGMSLVTAMSVSPAFAAEKTPTFTDNKQMVEYFWNEVFNKHNTTVIDEMTAPNYIQHNPGFQDGRQAFEDGIEGFLKEFPQSKAEIKHIGADGDLVFIHNHITLNDKDRGRLPSISSASRMERLSSTGTSSRTSPRRPKTTIRCSELHEVNYANPSRNRSTHCDLA
jgi:predicted SnoaL-like aldol condensation-catalyzing enzyme